MAGFVQSEDAENELRSVDSTQKELEDREKQSTEDEVTTKHSNSQSNCNCSEVPEVKESSVHRTSPPAAHFSDEDASETTRELLQNVQENSGSCADVGKTEPKEEQLKNTGENDGKKESLEFDVNKTAVSSNSCAQGAPRSQVGVGTGDWDRELLEQGMIERKITAWNQRVGGTEDWDQEMQLEGLTPPDFKLKKEDAVNEELVNVKFQEVQDGESGEACLGAVGGQPSTSSAVLQLPTEHGSQSLYHIKWIKWKNLNTPIITQNENGPCPLIALMNVLILQRKISIPTMQQIVSASQLMEYLGDCILDHAPERLTEGARLNYEQNMADAISIMCKLQTGLDVNVKFTGVADFEFTPECVVFDLLNIRLLHGWLVDPQNQEAVAAIGNLSYNQLVEKIIASKQDGASHDIVREGLIAESFLDQSASQLTYHGLYELNTKMGEEELCIFFRNNHFNTLFKHKQELFLLVTDQGYLTEEKVMWETLSNVEGDGCFVDANLQTIPVSQPSPSTQPNTAEKLPAGISQEDQDYLVALSLQEEQQNVENTTESWDQEPINAPTTVSLPPPPDQSAGMTSQEWTDLQLALQLQEEEQRKQQQQQQQQTRQSSNVVSRGFSGQTPSNTPQSTTRQPNPSQEHEGTQQNKECTIL